MGKIEGIAIRNYEPLKNVQIGRTYNDQYKQPLQNLVAVIGPSGNGKSTLADAFGFMKDCLEKDVETACDANNRGGYEKLLTQGAKEPISFELYYRESSTTRPITYELVIDLDRTGRPYVKEERLRQRAEKYGRPRSFLYLQEGKGFAFEGSDREAWGEEEDGKIIGEKKEVELTDKRRLGIVTLGAMKQNAGRGFSKQLFITTHSPFFVNALAPEDVWVLTKNKDGFSQVKCAVDYQYVKELAKEGVPLGDMWYSNYFEEMM